MPIATRAQMRIATEKQNWWLFAICSTLCAFDKQIVPTCSDISSCPKRRVVGTYVNDELEGLEGRAHVLELSTEDALREVSICPDRVTFRIQGAEKAP